MFRNALLLLLIFVSPCLAWAADIVHIGAGSYLMGIPEGAKGPPSPLRAAAFGKKVPSNDWWSSLLWGSNTFAHFAHPLALKVESNGLRIAYPANITANKSAIFGGMPARGDDFVIGNSAAESFGGFTVDSASDWFVTLRFSQATAQMRTSYGHGSPFVYVTCDGGAMRLIFSKPPLVWDGDANSSVLGISANGRHYGVFAPTGAKWRGMGGNVLTCDTAKNYFSVAVLPDNRAKTLQLFRRHAYAHITNTRVQWSYDEPSATVVTRYSFETKAFEGSDNTTLFALYPHQWRNTSAPLLPLSYNSVRGKMLLGEGSSFETKMIFPGVLPALPKTSATNNETIAGLLQHDFARPVNGSGDTYWAGKQLGKLASAISVADAHGFPSSIDALRADLKRILETWLTTVSTNAQSKSKMVFAYESAIGTLIGYPASYGSNTELNDHHFHYGYFIKAAAEVARRDPAWAADERFGGMVKLLIRDIASPQRDDPLFPFLRCFDPYAGHSWASGHARFADGNNNESSSEAMNAWCGIILFGEAIGDRPLRDLGIYLFTTEMNAINEYWFDVHGDNFPASYRASVITMVWGGKGANATWFSADPQMVHGINFLPIHGGSLYLGLFPDYAEKNYRALVSEFGSDQFKAWPDVLWMYRALSDADDAARLMDAGAASAKIEGGNSRANLRHWIESLQALGHVQREVTADYPLYAVFEKGSTRSYVVYNARRETRSVKFSDGQIVEAAPQTWTVTNQTKR